MAVGGGDGDEEGGEEEGEGDELIQTRKETFVSYKIPFEKSSIPYFSWRRIGGEKKEC